MKTKYLIATAFSLFALWGQAQRIHKTLPSEWQFRFSHQVDKNSATTVIVPHTWNAQDALSGKADYKRGIGNYEQNLYIQPQWKDKRIFLRFEGVNSIANVFINGKHLGEHRGGYSAFIFEITDAVNYGTDNRLTVRVSNAEQLDVMPLVGDFNFYGGIYRNVELIVTEPACISPLDYASPGVYLTQQQVSQKEAKVQATVKLSNRLQSRHTTIRIEIKDGTKSVCRTEGKLTLEPQTEAQITLPFTIRKPHLWNGRKDPFLYQAEVTLWENGTLLDKVVQPLGLRYYHIDADKGFFLNGTHLSLQGVCRHQDRAEVGNALRSAHHQEDMQLMLEMGVNAVRLAHYQQSEEMYDLTDRNGVITWAEIPFVGPGGYADKGFVDLPALKENGMQQLKELIRQNYNHPSICLWGLFNELKEEGDNPVDYLQELNQLAHQEDSTRPTTSASNQDGALNFITDCIAWNRYDGWYGGMPEELARFLDETHRLHPQLRIGISEYGAGASIYHQQDSLKRPVPSGTWHPENWQTFYHMENWKIIHERPFVWGTFVWNMFDFGAAHRREGDRPGINDKGLVTFDRKVKKDAYYFYQANWNRETPMIHIAGKRNDKRQAGSHSFQVFTNREKAELFVNGKSMGAKQADSYATIEWKDIPLRPGKNLIRVCTTGKQPIADECIIHCTE